MNDPYDNPYSSFSTGRILVFSWHWTARFYAWRARRHGFQTEIQDYGKYQDYELGGRYGVKLTK